MAEATRRKLGYTEENWCLAIDGGTGVTISAYLFGLSLSKATVQAAVNKFLSARPFLSSQIVSVNNKLFFELSRKSSVLVKELANPFMEQDPGKVPKEKAKDEEEAGEIWLKIVDLEMITKFPKAKPMPVLQVHLYWGLPDDSSLVVLRSHSAAADMVSAGTTGSEFLNCLKDVVQKEKSAGEVNIQEQLEKVTLDESIYENFEYYKAIEEAIPAGAAKKPFWAHGADVIGYGLVSRKNAYMPFRDTEKQRKSHLLRASLSKEATDRLLNACKDNSTDLYGALCAAVLKSVAAFKNVGNRGENYGIAVFVNVRALLDPKLSDESLGFYNSALMKTSHTSENHQYWQVAAKITSDFQDSIKNRKHFTDMGNLNMLMAQAIHHPNLTPSSSLRTAVLSILHDPVIETIPVEAAEVLQLKDFVSTSSIQGVGPCLAAFPFLRNGTLYISFVYCSPLFARMDMQTIIDSVLVYITV